jgi:tripartite-type tricarboxylate transporter receptor subunit TctC
MHPETLSGYRRMLLRALAIGSLPAACLPMGNALAQANAARFLVPFTPGGGSDLVARAMQTRLAAALGQPVVIENRPGGGITLASNLVAKAAPDGNTFLIVTIAHAVNASLYTEMPYDTVRDFTPISLVTAAPLILVVHPSVPAKNMAELIALAKSKPGVLNYASPGNGSPTHLSAELLKSMAGIDIVHIPYKGAGPATTDLLSGQVQMTFSSVGVALPHIKAGKLRPLAVTTNKRSAVLADVPTIAEAALPGYSLVSWQAIVAPAKMSAEASLRLNQAVVATLNSSEVKESLSAQGYDATPSSIEEASRFISSEVARYAKLVKSIGVRPD